MMIIHLSKVLPFVFLFIGQTIVLKAQSLPDSTLQSLEQAIEQLEKTQRAKQEVQKYESNLLQQEMTFKWTDAAPLLGGLIQTATNHSFNERPVLFKEKKYEYFFYLF